MEKQIKAVGYIRVSTAVQVTEGESLSTQRKQIADFAQQKGWDLTNIYADEGISGTKIENRLQFQQMVKDAREKKFDVIVFTKLSRFARNAREYLNMAHDFESQGIMLASIKENIDPTTRTGKMIAGILALFAEWEHETIFEQMNENKMAKWRDLRTFIGKPPYGYIWNKETRTLQVNEKEAAIYHKIVSLYMDEGLSFKDIEIRFRSEGIKSRQAYFASATISYMLKNPAYYGEYILNRYEYEDSARGAGKRRTKRKKPVEENITFPIPAMISKSKWLAIQEKTEMKKSKTKHASRFHEYILRDVLVCGECGGVVKPKVGSMTKDGKHTQYYACFWASTSIKTIQASAKQRCSLPYIRKEKMENLIWSDVMIKFALNPNQAIGDIFNPEKYQERIDELKLSISQLENDNRKLERARNRLFDILTDDEVDMADVKQRMADNKSQSFEIQSNIKEKQDQLTDLETNKENQARTLEFFRDNKTQLTNLRKQIRNLHPTDKKRLVEAMVRGKVTVHYQADSEQDGPGGIYADFTLQHNPAMLKRLVDEGILKLNLNTPHYLNLITSN